MKLMGKIFAAGLVILSLQLCVRAEAQTYVYTDPHLMWNDVACHVDGGVVEEGGDWRGKITYTVSRRRSLMGIVVRVLIWPIQLEKGSFI